MKEEAVEKPRRSDPYIWGIIIILYIVSVVEVYSAISREITGGDVYTPIIKHVLLLFSGFLITYVTSRVHYKWFKVMAYLMIPAAIVLLVCILFWGDMLNGAKRTITVWGVSLQGSEVAKVTIVLAMATVLAKSQIKRGVNTKGVVLVVVLVTIFSGLLFTQGLTNTLLFIGISVCMMLIGGVEWYKLGIIFLVYLVLALAVMQAKDILTESELFNKQEQTVQDGEKKDVLIQRSSTWKSRLEDFFDSTPEYEKETAIVNAEKELEVAKLNAEARIESAKADAQAQIEIAQAEARSIRLKSVEVARALGFTVTESLVTAEDGTQSMEYTIDFEGKTAEEVALITEYLKYIEYLSVWDGKLPATVITDGGASVILPLPDPGTDNTEGTT